MWNTFESEALIIKHTAASMNTFAVNITPKTVKRSEPNACMSGVFQKNNNINPMKNIEFVILPINEEKTYFNVLSIEFL